MTSNHNPATSISGKDSYDIHVASLTHVTIDSWWSQKRQRSRAKTQKVLDRMKTLDGPDYQECEQTVYAAGDAGVQLLFVVKTDRRQSFAGRAVTGETIAFLDGESWMAWTTSTILSYEARQQGYWNARPVTLLIGVICRVREATAKGRLSKPRSRGR